MTQKSEAIPVSVIIATYNREAELRNVIGYLLDQDYPDYEILAVDQTEKHEPETEDFLQRLPDKVRLIKQSPPGLTLARNRGIAEAGGEVLLFLDDDITCGRDLISAHLKHYRREEVGAVAGQIREEKRYHHRPPFLKADFIQWFPMDRYSSDEATDDAPQVRGGNFSVRREAALNVGQFDTDFIATAWGEEVDFSLRIRKAGYKIVFEPSASVFHLNVQTGGLSKRRRFETRTIFYEARNMTYMVEKNSLPRYYYLYLIWHIYVRTLPKKDYLTPKGLLFFIFGHFPFVFGLLSGFFAGLKNR